MGPDGAGRPADEERPNGEPVAPIPLPPDPLTGWLRRKRKTDPPTEGVEPT